MTFTLATLKDTWITGDSLAATDFDTVTETIDSLLLIPTGVKTTTYSAAANDLVPCNATSAGFTVTLPPAPVDGTRVGVKKIDATANAVTVATAGADVFNMAAGATTLSLALQYQAIVAQYNASAAIWYIISTDAPL